MIGDAFQRAVNSPKKRAALLAGGLVAALALMAAGGGIANAAGGLAPPPVRAATIHVASAVPPLCQACLLYTSDAADE